MATATAASHLESSVLLQEGEQLVKKVGGVFAFNVKDGPGGATARWVVDVKSGPGSVSVDPGRCSHTPPPTTSPWAPSAPASPIHARRYQAEDQLD